MDLRNFERDHNLVRGLGFGGQGAAALFSHKTSGQDVVLKESNPDNTEFDDEAEILKRLNHPNVIKCLGFAPDRIVIEFCDRGDLYHFRKPKTKYGPRVPESFIWSVFHQLIKALAYIHEGYGTEHFNKGTWKPVAHRDIKPDNILLDSGSWDTTGRLAVKLADFGGAIMEGVVPDDEWPGSMDWTPPEFPSWGPAADVWAVGGIVYYLAVGKPPVNLDADPGRVRITGGRPRVARPIDTEHPKHSHLGKYSPGLNALMMTALTLDPTARYSAVEILCILDEVLEPAFKECPRDADAMGWDDDQFPALPGVVATIMNEYATGVRKPSARFAAWAGFRA